VFENIDPSLLDLLPIPASVQDLQDRIVFFNAAARRLPSVRDEEMTGQSIFRFIAEPSHSVARQAIVRALATREPSEVSIVFDANGFRFSSRLVVVPLVRGDEAGGYLVFAYRGDGIATVLREAALHVDLTPRQAEVLRELSRGQSTEQIASTLGVSVATVRNHVQSILDQLGGGSRTNALAVGARRGLFGRRPLSTEHIESDSKADPDRG